jgi:hypothetical protein
VRLHHRAITSRRSPIARRLQHRRDLDRMVAVVVEDGDAVPVAGVGEAPLDAARSRRARRIASAGMPS